MIIDSNKSGMFHSLPKTEAVGKTLQEGRGRGVRQLLIFLFMIPFLLTSCYPTSHLPEDEQLYTGISEIAYNRKARARHERKHHEDSTGVITSLAEAYHTVEGLLAGHTEARDLLEQMVQRRDSSLTLEQLDTIRRELALLDKAMITTKEEVEAALAYAPNGSMFGSSQRRWPFSAGLCFYDAFVNDSSAVGRWLFNSFSTQPRTISMANPRLRTQVARQTLRNYGFFRGQVYFDVQPDPHDSLKAKIGYSVYPGPLYRFGKIEYQRFDAATDSLVRASASKALIHEGDAFTAPTLDSERKRLSSLFRNNGFYFYRPEYIGFRADTLQVPFRAQLQVRPKPDMPAKARNRYYMGRTNVTLMTYDDFHITDSTVLRDGSLMRWSGSEQTPLRYGALRHNMLYRRGDLYRQDVHDLISEKLSGMGIFSNLQVNYVPRDTSATCDTLDVNLFAVLDKPWDSELEAKVTNKSNGLLGPGISWGVTRRNAFRGAESLSFKLRGSYEWQTGASATGEGNRSLLNSYELGASASLTYPRIKFFGSKFARQLNRRAQGTTNYQLDADWMNRSSYFQMISFSGRLSYTYQRHRRVRNEFTPLRLDYNVLSHRSLRFDSVMTANPALYVSMRDQFVPSMSYSLTYTFNPHPDTQCSFLFNIKEAGNVLNVLYTLGGRGMRERNKKLLGAPFAEFLKCSFEWRETFRAGYHSKIAARALAGAVWSYGNSTMAPYADLFSIGGANSIRAFGIRTIGPGRYRPSGSSWSYVDQVGNIKLEANVEYRFPIITGSLEGALFLDAGNVWLMRPDESRPGACIDASHLLRDLALGTGFGFRYDLDFLVLRFDVGVGIHAPYDTGHSGYYNMGRFWDSLGFHIAVGYPF